MTRDKLYQQYLEEVAAFERYGSRNIISFEEWCEIKNLHPDDELRWMKSIKDNVTKRTVSEEELHILRELLGHSSSDVDTLE